MSSVAQLSLVPKSPPPVPHNADGPDVLRRAQQRFRGYLARRAVTDRAGLVRELERRAHRRGMPPQLAELLVFERLATPAEVREALQCGGGAGELAEVLVSAGLVTVAAMRHLQAQRIGIPCVDLDVFPVDEREAARIPPGVARRRLVLPICEIGGRTVVVVSDLRDRRAVEAARHANSAGIELAVAPAADLAEAIDRVFDADLTLPGHGRGE